MESFKRQSLTPPMTTEAASELQVLAVNNEPVVVHESKDFSLKKITSDNLSAEVEEPAAEEVAIAPAEAHAATQQLKALTSVGLGKRLGRDNSTIGRNKKEGNSHFRQWSKELDPDGIAWEFREGNKRSAQFHPLV